MTTFESALHTCLEGLRQHRWSIDECLERYPEHAAALRPHLIAAEALLRTYNTAPREDFAAAARERYLIATGQRLREAFDEEPAPSFFAAARVRFLMAAQRMRLGARSRGARGLPLFGTPFRALAGAGIAVVAFLSFSTYTVASASDALPGEWRYPIKRQTERVRLALAFSENAERDVRLQLAAERADEIQRLAQQGKIIGPGVIEDLARETAPLVADVDAANWDGEDITKLQQLTQQQKLLLEQVSGQVAPAAQDQLAEAKQVSSEGVEKTAIIQASLPVPAHITPVVPVSDTPTEEPADATETPLPSSTPGPGQTVVPPTQTPVPTQPPSGIVVVSQEPDVFVSGIAFVRLSQGRFSAFVPAEASGWRITSATLIDGAGPAQRLVRLSNTDGTELITLNPQNGDMYWFVLRNGRFDEVQVRGHDGKQVLIIDRDALRAVYGALADLPLFVLDSIELAPEPTPTPEPTETPALPPAQ